MAMQMFSSDAMDWAHIERLVRQKGCAGFCQRKFHENAHSPRQRGGKLEGGRGDGMGRGLIVRVGCKPAAVLENRTVDGAANTTMQGAAQTRGDQSVMHARQAGPSGNPKRSILAQ